MRYFSKRYAQEETMFPYVNLLFSRNGSFSFVTLFVGKGALDCPKSIFRYRMQLLYLAMFMQIFMRNI